MIALMVMPMLRGKVAVIGNRQPDLAVQDTEQWLAKTECEKHEQCDRRAFAAQPGMPGMPVMPNPTHHTAHVRDDCHTHFSHMSIEHVVPETRTSVKRFEMTMRSHRH